MLLTISIISGLMFFVYFCSVSLAKEEGSTNIVTYGAILVISIWLQSVVTGIVFLCIVVFMTILAVISYISKQ